MEPQPVRPNQHLQEAPSRIAAKLLRVKVRERWEEVDALIYQWRHQEVDKAWTLRLRCFGIAGFTVFFFFLGGGYLIGVPTVCSTLSDQCHEPGASAAYNR